MIDVGLQVGPRNGSAIRSVSAMLFDETDFTREIEAEDLKQRTEYIEGLAQAYQRDGSEFKHLDEEILSKSRLADDIASGKGEWPDPEPFACEKLPLFPTEALPEVLREWVEATAEATQTPVDLAAMQGLSVCAAAIAGSIDCIVRGEYGEPTNLYTATMLSPGNRKSAVHAAAIKPLLKYELELVKAARLDVVMAIQERRMQEKRMLELEKQVARGGEKSQGATLEAKKIAAWLEKNPLPVTPQIVTDDATVESLAIAMDQQGGTLASFSAEGGCFDIMTGRYSKQPNFDIFLKAHSGDEFRQSRVTRAPISMDCPLLTCCYVFQPYLFERLAENKDLRGQGLFARFLYSIPVSFIGSRKADPAPVPEEVRDKYHEMVKRLCELPEATYVYNEGADRSLREFFLEIEPMLGTGGDLSHLEDWASKLVGATARIATIFRVIEPGVLGNSDTGTDGLEVEVEDVEAAIEIARYLIPHADKAFGMLTASSHHETAAQELLRRIRGWVGDDGTLTRITLRNVHQRVRRQYTVQDLVGPLEELVERGWLRRVEQKDKRASPTFDIYPLVVGAS